MSNVGPQCNAPAARCHPLYRAIYLLCRAEHMTIAELARRAGVGKHTIEAGLRGQQLNPQVATIEACLGVFGYGLKPTPLPSPDE